MRSLTDLKTLFRKNLKVVPGGPPVGTPGQNRTAGVLAALDALAEEVKDIPEPDLSAYAKTQDVTDLTGSLVDLLTTAKTNLVAAVNELAGRAKAKYYAATGQNTDGAMTQKATTDALAKKANLVLRWPSLFSEQEMVPLQNDDIATLEQYRSYFFTSAAVTVALPVAWADTVAALIYLRATVTCTVTFQTGTLDAKASVSLEAGEWRIIRGDLVDGQSTSWNTVLRGNLLGSGAGGAGTVRSVNGVAPDAGGDVALATTDRYDVPQAVRDAVLAGTFSSGELQGNQPAGSLAGQRFTTATYGYEYERGAGGALVWCRYAKS